MANITFKLTTSDKAKEPTMQALLDMIVKKPQVQAKLHRMVKKTTMRWIYETKIMFDGQIFYPASCATLTKEVKDE